MYLFFFSLVIQQLVLLGTYIGLVVSLCLPPPHGTCMELPQGPGHYILFLSPLQYGKKAPPVCHHLQLASRYSGVLFSTPGPLAQQYLFVLSIAPGSHSLF